MAGKLPIIIINGKGGCGKDSLIDGLKDHGWWPFNLSSVDLVKDAGKVLGWNGGKSDKDRKFLHDLKTLSTEYNDGPNSYLCYQALSIMKWCLPYDAHMDKKHPEVIAKSPVYSLQNADGVNHQEYFFNNGVIFMHCREPENIEALQSRLEAMLINDGLDKHVVIATIVVSRQETDDHVYGNHCDDDVYDYIYDYYIDNNGTVDEGVVALSEVLQAIRGQ